MMVVPDAIPEKAGPDAVHIASAAVEECEFLNDLELPAHRERSDSARSGKDSVESWRHENDYLHPGRACVSRRRGKTKSCEKSTGCATPMLQNTAMIWIGFMQT